jgi:hypothetical protein
MDPDLVRIVEFLERNRIRATYGAVGESAGVPPRSVGSRLGDRCPLASWVVKAATGEPTSYYGSEKHPDLHINAEIITSARDLIRRMRREPY